MIDADRQLPTLYRDRAFWGMTVTQFLGALNDNVFKQLLLLLAIPVGVAGSLAITQDDKQGLATIVFSLPFVLFSGYAGFLSDQRGKRGIIVLSKVAEIVVMAMGLFAFLSMDRFGYPGLLLVLFLMGTQSAFFGPGKYGILPEMLREEDLPRANGFILMTTFIAIIFGTVLAGFLGDFFAGEEKLTIMNAVSLWKGSVICVGIAVIGTLSSLLIRRVPPSRPNLRFRIGTLAIPAEVRKLVRHDRQLVGAIIASSMFWLVGGLTIPVINSFGREQLQMSMKWTSLLVAMIAIGIAAGAVIAGKLSQGKVDFRFVRLGSWGIAGCAGMMSISTQQGQILGYSGSLIMLMLLGASAGFFAIPVQVFIQTRPPEGLKGRTIALMNQMNFIAIMISGFVYTGFDKIVIAMDWQRSTMFAMTAMVMLPVAIFYKPRDRSHKGASS